MRSISASIVVLAGAVIMLSRAGEVGLLVLGVGILIWFWAMHEDTVRPQGQKIVKDRVEGL